MSTYDVVLYGASGFTGRQTAEYFEAHAPAGLRWAIAGRTRTRLEAVAADTHPTGIIVADSTDPTSVEAMVRQARVLLTTAGPFAQYGDPVVDACVAHGVDGRYGVSTRTTQGEPPQWHHRRDGPTSST